MRNHIYQPRETLQDERYEIIDFLGEGGMQQVFVAVDHSFDREVAIKTPKEYSGNEKFHKSATLSAKVLHPNVARTMDYFVEGDRPHLVEELVEGVDLGVRLSEDFHRFDPHLAAHVFYHLTKGLAASHHVGVVHRDIKPSNIIVSRDHNMLEVKITDFGIATMAKDEIDNENFTVTKSKTVLGALPYMAPEVVDRSIGIEVSGKADVWAVGAILAQTLIGDFPFGKGLPAVTRILAGDLPEKPTLFKVKKQFEGLGSDLWNICLDCLRQNPAERPAADDLALRCSQLCYSIANRLSGVVSSFGEGVGNTGWISGGDGKTYFFHDSSYYSQETAKVGAKVSYVIQPGFPKDRASPILPLI